MQNNLRSSENILISIVVPFFNEEEIIKKSIKKIYSVLMSLNQSFEMILIDDGSLDNSGLEVNNTIKELNFCDSTLLTLSRNFGKKAALSAGLDHAKGGIIIPIDCDMQDPPELIEMMLEKWEQGFDVVYAVRKSRKGESIFKKVIFLFFL